MSIFSYRTCECCLLFIIFYDILYVAAKAARLMSFFFVVQPFGELKYDAPPDLTKIPVNKATGETVLHRAARLGHVVSEMITVFTMFSLVWEFWEGRH